MATVSAALRNRHWLTGDYNGGLVLIAPYLLYERHGVPHLAGLTLTRDGRELRGEKLSVYRLPGIRNLCLSGQAFEPEAVLVSTHSHPVDRVLATVLEPPSGTFPAAGRLATSGPDHG